MCFVARGGRGGCARVRVCWEGVYFFLGGGGGSTPPTLPPTRAAPTRSQYTYEKEIVMYAYFKRLDYFSTGGWVGWGLW